MDHCKNKKRKFVQLSLQLCQQVPKPCTFCILKMQFLYGGRIATRNAYLYSNMIREKAKSCGNLKQKEGERSDAGKVNASKGWSDHFRKKLGLKKSQDNRKSSFYRPKGCRQFPGASKRIPGEKRYRPEEVSNADESAPFWGGNVTKDIL